MSLLQLTKIPADSEYRQLELSVNAQDVMWSGFASNIPSEVTALAPQGAMRDERFVVSEILLHNPLQAIQLKLQRSRYSQSVRQKKLINRHSFGRLLCG